MNWNCRRQQPNNRISRNPLPGCGFFHGSCGFALLRHPSVRDRRKPGSCSDSAGGSISASGAAGYSGSVRISPTAGGLPKQSVQKASSASSPWSVTVPVPLPVDQLCSIQSSPSCFSVKEKLFSTGKYCRFWRTGISRGWMSVRPGPGSSSAP